MGKIRFELILAIYFTAGVLNQKLKISKTSATR